MEAEEQGKEKNEIIKRDQAILNVKENLMATCAMHGIQLTLSNPVIQCCGEG